jgi:hypothetical protein
MAITVTLINSSDLFGHHWAVIDGNSNQTVLDRQMEPQESQTVELQTGSTGNWGEIRYKHEEQSVWTHKGFISDGDNIDLY